MELTQQERDRMVDELLRQQEDINGKLRLLGLDGERDKPKKAPDGGPVSDAHRFLPPHRTRTVTVRRNDANGASMTAVVEPEDVRPDDEVVENAPAPRRVTRPTVQFSTATRDEMLTMSIAALKALPEAKLLDKIPDVKSDLVDALVAVRGK